MKKGFFKANWTFILTTLGFIAAGVFLGELIVIVVAALFLFITLNNYRLFDSEAQAADNWWNSQKKEDKIAIQNRK